MTFCIRPVSSKSLALTRPNSVGIITLCKKVQDSFDVQIADHYHLSQPIRVPIPRPTLSAYVPQPFAGTCAELLTRISDMVHSTIDNTDYNGLQPYLNLIDRGNPLPAWTIDSRNEGSGSTCAGMSFTILKKAYEQHGVQGALAVQRKSRFHNFQHVAAIIKCSDGLVLLDPQSDPASRIYSIPFNSTLQCRDFSIAASKKEETPHLVIQDRVNAHEVSEFCVNVVNGDDIVMKRCMSQTVTEYIPIVVFKKDGKPLKDIKVSLTRAQVVLKTHSNGTKELIKFEDIQKHGLFNKLTQFMGSDFHISPQVTHDQILRVISQREKIMKLFAQYFSAKLSIF